MASTDAGNTPAIDPNLARRVFQSVAADAIRSGRVDPKGKGPEQLSLELVECIRDEYLGNISGIVTDHSSSVLKHARRFRQDSEHYFACLFYATWVEHWLNDLISTGGQRRNLDAEEVVQIIRDTPLRGKLTWLLGLFGLPRLAARHRNALIRLTDLRNGFVHYKWQGKDDAALDREKQEINQVVNGFEATVKYLQSYITRNIFKGSLGRVRKVLG